MKRQVLQKSIQSSKSGHDPSIRVLYSLQIKLWPTLDCTFHLKNWQDFFYNPSIKIWQNWKIHNSILILPDKDKAEWIATQIIVALIIVLYLGSLLARVGLSATSCRTMTCKVGKVDIFIYCRLYFQITTVTLHFLNNFFSWFHSKKSWNFLDIFSPFILTKNSNIFALLSHNTLQFHE